MVGGRVLSTETNIYHRASCIYSKRIMPKNRMEMGPFEAKKHGYRPCKCCNTMKFLYDRDISTLSDGQFQKACIATGLSRKADLLLLDEPTAFLDAESRVEVLAAIRDAARSGGSAILFSSHDLYEARKVADREITL